jgi:hypothetical protein
MLNMKKLLNQLIDSLLMITPPETKTSINKSIKNGTHSKDTGIISTSDILTIPKLPPPL